MKTLRERFEEQDPDGNEFLKFDRVEHKLNRRPDLHAFLLLDSIVPGNRDIIGGASHEVIFIGIDEEELNTIISDEQIRDLRRCGIFYSEEFDCLASFV